MFKKMNDKLNRFSDWMDASDKRMLTWSIIAVTFWAILFATVLRKQFDASLPNDGKYDYITSPIAYLITIPVYYWFLKYMAKRRREKKK